MDEEFFDGHRGIWWRIDTLIVTSVDRSLYELRSHLRTSIAVFGK
ncbi:hypothetical protein QUA97_14425 [Microcoleus sp. CZ3-B2]